MLHADSRSRLWLLAPSLLALMAVVASAWGQQGSPTPSNSSAKDSQPVVQDFGSEGDYRTELSSQTVGKMTDDDRRQASLLMVDAFQHIAKARDLVDAEDSKAILKEVGKSREAIKAVRAMLPKTTVRTRTIAPDGKVVFEDETEYQDGRITIYEGIVHAQTLAPILASRKDALEFAGYHVVEAETIATEILADAERIDVQLKRAVKALEDNKTDVAAKALAMVMVKGIHVRVNKEDSELASARDAIWLAKRSLEENNTTQALVNLATAVQRLKLYREVASQEQRPEVDQMLREVDQLVDQLRQEGNRKVSQADRTKQGGTVTGWWDRINGWFKKHL